MGAPGRGGAAAAAALLFVMGERNACHPLLDLGLIARPLVSSGLAFKAAAGLIAAGLSYLVTLQLQLARGWPPAVAALGVLPQVVRVRVRRDRSRSRRRRSASGRGRRAIDVLNGLPKNRTSIGAALTDTTTEVANGMGITVAGTLLAALFTGSVTASDWTARQSTQFAGDTTLGGLVLTLLAAAFVLFGFIRSRSTVAAERTPDVDTRQGSTVLKSGDSGRIGDRTLKGTEVKL